MPRFKGLAVSLRGQPLPCRRHESRVHCYRVRQHYPTSPATSPAQEEARAQNTTLHELFRNWLKVIVGRIRAPKYRALMNKLRYADAGRKCTRDEMNER